MALAIMRRGMPRPAMVVYELKAGASQVRASSSSSSSSGTNSQAGGDSEEPGDRKDSGNLYAVLGLPRGSSAEEIKAAYRRVAKECHPDLTPGDAVAAARFRAVNHAHRTLLHVGLRRMYDLHLQRQEAQERCDKEEQESRGPRNAA